MDTNLKTLIDNYGRACRRDGNPAWESDEGVALLAYAQTLAPSSTPDPKSTNDLAAARRARDGFEEEARILHARLAEAHADNDLLRQRVDRNAWIFQGGADDLESLANGTAVVIHADALRGLLAKAAADAACVVPAEVIGWRDAYRRFLDASATYNERLNYITKHCPFGTHPEAEEAALQAAQRKANAAVMPMLDALSTAIAPPEAEARAMIHETYTGQNGWLTVPEEEYERTKHKYDHRVRYARPDEAAAYGLPDIAEFDLLVDDYQCEQKDGNEDTRAAARIALNSAYRKALNLATGTGARSFTRGLATGLSQAASLVETTREVSSIVGGEEQQCLLPRNDPGDRTGKTWVRGIRDLIPAGSLPRDTAACAADHGGTVDAANQVAMGA